MAVKTDTVRIRYKNGDLQIFTNSKVAIGSIESLNRISKVVQQYWTFL